MDAEELEPPRRQPDKPDLEVMSITELNDYVAALEAEIARARVLIGAKQTGRVGAESLFRKK